VNKYNHEVEAALHFVTNIERETA